jgi:uncharacterized protein
MHTAQGWTRLLNYLGAIRLSLVCTRYRLLMAGTALALTLVAAHPEAALASRTSLRAQVVLAEFRSTSQLAPAPNVALEIASGSQATPVSSQESRALDWDALLPERERSNYRPGPPPAIHDYLGERAPGIRQNADFAVNPALNGAHVKIPGFVVPLVMTETGVVIELFLVPYYGACIHVPPPPPNQIIYVKMQTGFRIKSLYDAYWISGELHTASKALPMASAAYTLTGAAAEPYEYPSR